MMLKHFELNKEGRDVAVGDIHGCFSRLQAELDRIGFDPAKDRLFSVGDLVDRGPENEAVIAWLEKPWFHAVMGNHDDMAMRWPLGNMQGEIYRRNGGGWNMDQPRESQERIASAMAQLPVAIEVETELGIVGIVHADCPYVSWQAFVDALEGKHGKREADHVYDMAMWSRGRITDKNVSGVPDVRAVVVGHTPLTEAIALGNVLHIDTGAVFGRDFTLLNLATLEVL
ncbi:metallophosphoesterase [Achromobacter xylosoxidans]|uniref:metallophosphoesterase n=1 Tax=Alcaligenes xylosoxydans xylosoxydans TaxID=85698 RepID=UPI0006C0C2F2|nr:metallophosphoesterase [Achromobacter xylosoxidans]CUJ41701.1 Serine/threonine-protein phosphatase 1 [Achromobacter xylosoxidans]